MSNTHGVPNPLRPYHIPQPTVHQPIDISSNPSIPPSAGRPPKPAQPAEHGLGSSAREMLSELDYSEYLLDASPSVLEVVKGLLDQGLWKYTSVLMAQPFDLAKVVLQVQDAGDVNDEEEESEKPRSNATSRTKPYDVSSEHFHNTLLKLSFVATL